MTRIPRVRLALAVTALLALLVVPMAGARTLSPSSAHSTDSGWLSAALLWVEDFAGLRNAGHHGQPKPPVHQKDGLNQPNGGSCIDPQGHPRPICL